MSSPNMFSRLFAVLLCTSTLGACSTVAAYRKCGFSGCLGDSAISSDVEQRFSHHPSIEPPNLIDVQTIDRVVYLYGLVDTDLQRSLAESVAAEASGVKRVEDLIGLRNNAW